MMPVGSHTMTHPMLVGQRGSGSNLTQSVSSIGAIAQVMTLEDSKMPSRKADQLTFNIGYNGDG